MDVKNQLGAEQCWGMGEIRRAIDTLERSLIQLLGARFKYVLVALRFKSA
ncbi:hypothetical protein GV819_05665 [Pseudomonas sp. Fl5BN2]|nr:hypothetical protein [Pseudomonas sp. Fl5BN2]NBF01773.1 hypothetical protein [Pseudomonas sp. Fl5BN2]